MKTKRRTPRPVEELVDGWFTGLAAAGAPPAADAAPPPTGDDAPSGDEADAAVEEAIKNYQTAAAALVKAQDADPDTDDPADKAVAALAKQAAALGDQLEAAQSQDTDSTAAPADAPAPPASPAPKAETPPPAAAASTEMAAPAGAPPAQAAPVATDAPPTTTPSAVDATDDVDDDAQCLDPDCLHLASGHADTDTGTNTGACSMANCECTGMKVPDADDIGGEPPAGASPEAQGAAAATATQAMAAAPPSVSGPADGGSGSDPTEVSPGVSGTPADSGNGTADPVDTVQDGGPGLDQPTGAMNGPAFTIPVLIIEGIQTSDGRMVAPNALTWRNPPLPLMGLSETTDYGHTGAVICGRIDSVVRDGNTLVAQGFFDVSEDGLEFARLVEAGMITGVSADIADTISETIVTEVGPDGFPIAASEQITQGELMGATVCPFPAFEGAYIVLGDGSDGPPAIPMQKPTPEQAAAGIHVLSVEEACVPCAEGMPIAASGGPLAPPREWFADPELAEPTRLRVDDDGRVYGHFALKGVCHVGVQGRCIEVPMGCDMSEFHQGYVVCADGSEVDTGAITAGIGHADTSGRISNAAVMAHYDNALYGVADVVAGEDEFGQWIAGALRPTATEEQVHSLRASSLSGDWRPKGRGYALYAALSVNRPGFPITKATKVNGRLSSVVAAGMIVDPAPEPEPSEQDRLGNLERIVAAGIPAVKASLAERWQRARA